MFVRYPYKRNGYYRSRAAPMEIDREESPIWAMPVGKRELSNSHDREMKNRKSSNKRFFNSKKGNMENSEEEEGKEENLNSSSQNKLVKYVPNKEKETEHVNDEFVESESDYEEDSMSTDNQLSFEYQIPQKLFKPTPYNKFYFNEQNAKKSNSEYLKDSSFPQLLLSYSKFLFNVLLLVTAVWLLFYFIKTIKADINVKYKEHLMDNMNDISECYKHYEVNKCSSDMKIPFLENECKDWEVCMSKNPEDIKVIMIGAEVISEILNKFIDPLSIKSTIVISVLCVIFFIIIWKINSIPTNKNKEKSNIKEQSNNNKMNDQASPLGMCPPHAMDPRLMGNGVFYQVAPAAVYPGDSPYPVPMAYPPVYPFNPLTYPYYPIYQQEPNSSYSSRSPPKRRNSPKSQRPSNKNYRFVKSSHNRRNPYNSRFNVKPYPREKYYYEEDDMGDYEMVDDYDDRYYDEDYRY